MAFYSSKCLHFFFVGDVIVLEVLKFQVAHIPSVEDGSSHDVVQMSDGFFFFVAILMIILVLFCCT